MKACPRDHGTAPTICLNERARERPTHGASLGTRHPSHLAGLAAHAVDPQSLPRSCCGKELEAFAVELRLAVSGLLWPTAAGELSVCISLFSRLLASFAVVYFLLSLFYNSQINIQCFRRAFQ